MTGGYPLLKRSCQMMCTVLLMAGMAQTLRAQETGACPCFKASQLKGLFSPIVRTEGTVRCMKSLAGAYTYVSIYGNSVNENSGKMMAVTASAQSSVDVPEANICSVSQPQKGDTIDRYIRFEYYLTEEEAGACMSIIENAAQAFGAECVEMD